MAEILHSANVVNTGRNGSIKLHGKIIEEM
jgi:hypothetical protein